MEIDLNLAEMTLLIVDRKFLSWQTKYQIIFHIMAYIQLASYQLWSKQDSVASCVGVSCMCWGRTDWQ